MLKEILRFIEIQKEMKLEVIFMLEMLLKSFTTPLSKKFENGHYNIFGDKNYS